MKSDRSEWNTTTGLFRLLVQLFFMLLRNVSYEERSIWVKYNDWIIKVTGAAIFDVITKWLWFCPSMELTVMINQILRWNDYPKWHLTSKIYKSIFKIWRIVFLLVLRQLFLTAASQCKQSEPNWNGLMKISCSNCFNISYVSDCKILKFII